MTLTLVLSVAWGTGWSRRCTRLRWVLVPKLAKRVWPWDASAATWEAKSRWRKLTPAASKRKP